MAGSQIILKLFPQATQLDRPGVDANELDEQREQVDAPAVANVPAAQIPQAAVGCSGDA